MRPKRGETWHYDTGNGYCTWETVLDPEMYAAYAAPSDRRHRASDCPALKQETCEHSDRRHGEENDWCGECGFFPLSCKPQEPKAEGQHIHFPSYAECYICHLLPILHEAQACQRERERLRGLLNHALDDIEEALKDTPTKR